jgi:hypothetical protein
MQWMESFWRKEKYGHEVQAQHSALSTQRPTVMVSRERMKEWLEVFTPMISLHMFVWRVHVGVQETLWGELGGISHRLLFHSSNHLLLLSFACFNRIEFSELSLREAFSVKRMTFNKAKSAHVASRVC